MCECGFPLAGSKPPAQSSLHSCGGDDGETVGEEMVRRRSGVIRSAMRRRWLLYRREAGRPPQQGLLLELRVV